MGGKQKTDQTQTTNQTENVSQTSNSFGTQRSVLDPYYNDQFKQTQGAYNTLLGQGPQVGFSSTPSPLVSNLLARKQQSIMGQNNANLTRMGNMLGVAGTGNNQALLAALQGQSQIRQAGALNGLSADALAMQLEYDNAKNAANQAAYNSQLSGYGSLLSALGGMAQAGATKEISQTDNTSGTSTLSSIQTGKSKTKKSFF